MTLSKPADGAPRPLLKSRRSAIVVCAIIAASVALAVLFTRQLALGMSVAFPICILNRLGFHCPLCGGTRCVLMLLRGRIFTAFYYNPLIVLAAVWGLYLFLRLAASCFRRVYTPYRMKSRNKAAVFLLIITALFFICRNIPLYKVYLY